MKCVPRAAGNIEQAAAALVEDVKMEDAQAKVVIILYFPVWLRNRLLSAGLEPILSQTEKSCIASNYRQFSTNIKIKIIKLKNFHFDIRGKLSLIRCDKYIFLHKIKGIFYTYFLCLFIFLLIPSSHGRREIVL